MCWPLTNTHLSDATYLLVSYLASSLSNYATYLYDLASNLSDYATYLSDLDSHLSDYATYDLASNLSEYANNILHEC